MNAADTHRGPVDAEMVGNVDLVEPEVDWLPPTSYSRLPDVTVAARKREDWAHRDQHRTEMVC